MRILLIINELLYTCGVSSHTYNLLSGLKDRNNIDLYLLCGGGNAIEKFNNLNIPIIINENFKHESRSIKGYTRAVKFLYQLVKDKNIDIIHSHHHYAASIAHKVSLLTETSTVLTNHGILAEVGHLNHFAADYLIVVNEHVVDYLVSKKIKYQNSIRLIRNGIPIKDADRKYNIDKLKILAASRLVPTKGLDIYIRAVSLLPIEMCSRAEFYIAGEGFYEKELQNINTELKTNISFLGRITDLNKILNDFDVFVIPTSSDSEGFPMTIIEAGMNKNLIISSNFWGLEYVFENEKHGLVFEIGDYQGLAKIIEMAINNFENMSKYIENFHSKVKSIFNIETMIENTIKYYEDILLVK